MRLREFNFAIAIAVSIAAHVLLWPASKHIALPVGVDSGNGSRGGRTLVTLILNGDASEPPKPDPLPVVKPPEPDSPDDLMGKAKAKGTGAESAKGNQPLMAREGDQDQAYLGHHPPGSGRSDVPSDETKGDNGSGGQRGGPQVAVTPPAPVQPRPPSVTPKSPDAVKDQADEPAVKPRHSPLKQPAPIESAVAPPDETTPPPSKTASVGAAKPDLTKPPVDEVKATGPLVQTATVKEGSVPAAPKEGPTVLPVPASGTAPPTPGAPADRQSVVVAPQLPLPKAVVAAPPPPAVEKARDKAKSETVTPTKAPTPPVQIASAAPTLVNTGDGRAPGQDRTAADPSQESESESDAFSKHAISAVFRDGKLEIRDGREVKTRHRPIFGLAAQIAFSTISNPDVVLRIVIDEKGNVKNVELAKSCGSDDIDQPCRVAAYTWWIEPTHDKKGRPMTDIILFTISFR